MIVVRFILFRSFFTETCISSFKLWSILEKGSSNNSRSGLDIKDLAKDSTNARRVMLARSILETLQCGRCLGQHYCRFPWLVGHVFYWALRTNSDSDLPFPVNRGGCSRKPPIQTSKRGKRGTLPCFDPHACCGRRETDRTLPASDWLRSWHPPNVFYWHWLRISTPIEDLCCWLRAGLASRRRDDHRFQVFDWMNIVWRLIDLRWTKTVLA